MIYMNKIRFISWLVLFAFGLDYSVSGNTVEVPDARANLFLGELIERAYIKNGSIYPSDWAELERLEKGAFTVDQFLPRGVSVKDVYSFIRPDQRRLFPDGDLILIRNSPVDWPREWSNPKRIDLSDPHVKATMEGWMSRNGNYLYNKPIRYLIYRGGDGVFLSKWWYEENFRAMVARTGLIIPEPARVEGGRAGVGEGREKSGTDSHSLHIASGMPAVVSEKTRLSAQSLDFRVLALWAIGIVLLLGGIMALIRKNRK